MEKLNGNGKESGIRDLKKVRLYSGSIHPALAQSIAKHLKIPVNKALVSQFSNGETRVEITETCRGTHAYVVQPIAKSEDGSLSVNDALMEVLVFASALKRASAKSITLVLPVYGYARQDKKEKSRASITARLVADLLEAAGIDRLITVDLHSTQIEGFFRKPVDNLSAQTLLIRHIEIRWPMRKEDLVIVSPDAGGAKRAVSVAKSLGVDCAIISKERAEASTVEKMMAVGPIKGRVCVLVDDMADTCGTLIMAADTLMKAGAVEVHAYVVHGIFSGAAIKKLADCQNILSIVATNTIPQTKNSFSLSKLHVIDISLLLASSITLIHTHQSLSRSNL